MGLLRRPGVSSAVGGAAMTEPADDPSLIGRLGGGDQDALAELFAAHRERLRKMVEFRLDPRLNGRVSTSDVLQDAYIDALKRAHHYQPEKGMPFYLWLRWVTAQRLVEVHRHHFGASIRDLKREAPLGRLDLSASTERMAGLIGEMTSPSHAAERGEALDRLHQALDRLDPIDREVLALRHFEELGNHEVAALLEIRPAAASKRYIRALGRLKDALAGQAGSDPEAGLP